MSDAKVSLKGLNFFEEDLSPLDSKMRDTALMYAAKSPGGAPFTATDPKDAAVVYNRRPLNRNKEMGYGRRYKTDLMDFDAAVKSDVSRLPERGRFYVEDREKILQGASKAAHTELTADGQRKYLPPHPGDRYDDIIRHSYYKKPKEGVVSWYRGWNSKEPPEIAHFAADSGGAETRYGTEIHEAAHHIYPTHHMDFRRNTWLTPEMKKRIGGTMHGINASGMLDHAGKTTEIVPEMSQIKRQHYHDRMPRRYEDMRKRLKDDREGATKWWDDPANAKDKQLLIDYQKFLQATPQSNWQPTEAEIDHMISDFYHDGTGAADARYLRGSDKALVGEELKDFKSGKKKIPLIEGSGHPFRPVIPLEEYRKDPELLDKLRSMMKISKNDAQQPPGFFTGRMHA